MRAVSTNLARRFTAPASVLTGRRMVHECARFTPTSSSSSGSQGSWRSFFSRAGLGIGAFMSALTISAVAAKAPDTPEYLLPYYLRSARARFNHYASIREKGGVRFMTVEDFVAAMLAAKDSSVVTPAAVEELKALFDAADANADGRVSFREFSFLSILLCTSKDDFALAFKMFDEECKGGLTKAQFKKMIRVFGDETMKPTMKSGLVAQMFDTGKFAADEKGRQTLSGKRQALTTLDKFLDVIGGLERAILVAEFRLADSNSSGKISRRAFGELLTNSILGRHLPFFMVDNLRKMSGSDSAKNAITLDSWLVFNEMMQKSDDVSEALAMYAANGLPVLRDDFARAVNAVGLSRPMSKSEIDLVFEIFDRDGNGDLEYDEFASVMRNKAKYNVLEQEKERNNFFVQFAKCASEAVSPEDDDDVA